MSRKAPYPPGIRCEALECGSLLPLLREPACWRGVALPVEVPAGKLARRKAAASCRTLKLRTRELDNVLRLCVPANRTLLVIRSD